MKSKLKKLTMASTLSLIAGYAIIAPADNRLNETLGATVGATDVFHVRCESRAKCHPSVSNCVVRLGIQVRDKTAGASILSLQVRRLGTARNTTDPKGADSV